MQLLHRVGEGALAFLDCSGHVDSKAGAGMADPAAAGGLPRRAHAHAHRSDPNPGTVARPPASGRVPPDPVHHFACPGRPSDLALALASVGIVLPVTLKAG